MTEHQEQIKHRILRHAAQFWGYHETEMDAQAFDPMVELLAGAVATEVSLAQQEMSRSNERIEERLLQLLAPETEANAVPAHAIAHARSVGTQYRLRTNDQLYCPKVGADGQQDIFFRPFGNLSVVDGDIKYLAVGTRAYQIDQIPLRDTVLQAMPNQTLPAGSVWLGLELNGDLPDLMGLRFYVNWRNDAECQDYLAALSTARWSIDGKTLAVARGMSPTLPYPNPLDVYSPVARLTRDIQQTHQNNFFTITGWEQSSDAEWTALQHYYPTEFEGVFPLEELAAWQSPLLWVKLETNSWIPHKALDTMICHINAFPVANLHRLSKDFNLNDYFNMLPLATSRNFFDVESVHNQKEQAYRSLPGSPSDADEKGTYALRWQAVGSFRQQDGMAKLEELIHLLRDEADAFAAFDLTYQKHTLTNIRQHLSSLEQHLAHQDEGGTKGQLPYLFIRPLSQSDRISVDYWETHAAEGNGLSSGLGLEAYRVHTLQRGSLQLLTTTQGGRDKLTHRERKQRYEYAFLSKGNLVSAADIRTYCLSQVGHLVSKVTMEKDYEIGAGTKEGVRKVLKVQLIPLPGQQQSLAHYLPTLQTQLSQQTAFFIPVSLSIVAHED